MSCGCLQIDTATTHGAAKGGTETAAYRVWVAMRARCSDPKDIGWKNYGGRGIAVCERWQEFANFLTDMGERPPGMSIERLDNDGTYSPENCVWANAETQARNRRNTVYVTICGQRKPLVVACSELGVGYYAVQASRYRTGVTAIEAFFDVLDRKVQAGTART